MTEDNVALLIEWTKGKFNGVTPHIISDNGPWLISKVLRNTSDSPA
jgi:hypothetical protein